MAKSKRRRKAKPSSKPGAPAKKGVSRNQLIIGAVSAVLIVAGVWWWDKNQRIEGQFFDYVAQGRGTLDRVERIPEHGTSGHLAPGERVNYGTTTPTSGRHDTRDVSAGVYDTPRTPAMLVHSLEHGMVVVYYDRLSADALAILEDWSGLYAGRFSGLVVTPKAGLGDKLQLTAWNKSLTLERFDAPAAAVFIDAYRGRGPENPIR